jgi:uncharacterized protein (DUF885 family)
MKKIVSLLLVLVLVLSLTACAKVSVQKEEPEPEPTATPAPKENWADIDRDFFKEYLSSDLTSLHQLVKDPAKYGIDYDSVERSLGTYKQDSDREWYAFEEGILKRMDCVDVNALSEQDKLAYDTLRQYIEWDLEGEAFYGYYEPLTPYTGIQADLPLVFWFYELNTKQDVEDYLTLLADVPRFFSELLEYEQYRAEKLNIFMIEANLNAVMEDLDKIIGAKDTIFLIPLFMENLAKVEGLSEEEIQAYQDRNVSLLTNEFHQAFVDLKAGLEALRPYCREAQGIKASGNEAYLKWYEYKLKDSCDEEADPDFLATLLLSYGRDFLSKALNAYQTASDSDHVSLGTVEENVAYLRSILDPLLPPLPDVDVRYEEVAEELRDVASPAFYLIPAFDDWQNNMIGLNEPQKAKNLLSTLAHEGFDGHLYQHVYHRSMPGLSLTQQLLESTAYAEAWSQFSEHLLADHIDKKYTVDDMRAFHYGSQCIVELVGYWSIRVNYFGDGFDKVYAQLGRLTGYEKEEFRKEIYDPYIIGSPFYYMPYAYGYARLLDLMERTRNTLGDKFDEKAFYAQYLNYGPSHFNLLADRLDQWAKAQ